MTCATLLSLLPFLTGLVLKVIIELVQVIPCCTAISHCLNYLVVTDTSIQTLSAPWVPHAFCCQDKTSHMEERINCLPCIYDPTAVSPQLSLYSSSLSPTESIGSQGCVGCFSYLFLPWSVTCLPFKWCAKASFSFFLPVPLWFPMLWASGFLFNRLPKHLLTDCQCWCLIATYSRFLERHHRSGSSASSKAFEPPRQTLLGVRSAVSLHAVVLDLATCLLL